MIKLIVSDMDGTLFNGQQEISPLNRAALKEAEKQGVRFMIATGRSMETIGDVAEKYDLHCGFILLNGAEIRDEDHKILNTINIEPETVKRLSSVLEEMGYIPEYMTDKGSQLCGSVEMMERNMGWRMMCLDRTHTLTLEEAIIKGRTSVFQSFLTRNDTLEAMFDKGLEVRKMIVFNPDCDKNRANKEKLKEMFPELAIVSSYPDNIEINHKKAQKGYGLMEFVKKMNLKKEEVAVFGDGLNDMSMFNLFPNAYAPVNAEPEIRAKALEVIPSNNEDGVGKKIFEILYKNKEELADRNA